MSLNLKEVKLEGPKKHNRRTAVFVIVVLVAAAAFFLTNRKGVSVGKTETVAITNTVNTAKNLNWSASVAEAQEMTTMLTIKKFSVETEKMRYPFAGKHTVSLPNSGSALTESQRDELIEGNHYRWRTDVFNVRPIDLEGYTLTEVIDMFGKESVKYQALSGAVEQKIKNAPVPPKGDVLTETKRITANVVSNIGNAVVGSIEGTLGVSPSFGELEGKVADHQGYIDALWMEHHGLKGITVRMVIDAVGQNVRLYDIDSEGNTGDEVSFRFAVSTGTLDGKQAKRTVKIYAVAYAIDSASYTIYNCPDALAAPLVDGAREITLTPYIANLRTKRVTKKALKIFPAGLSAERKKGQKMSQIEALFAPTATEGK